VIELHWYRHIVVPPNIRMQTDETLMLALSRSHKSDMMANYTVKQGQYLAFIHHYTKLNGRPPAESDMEHYFRVRPPSVHQMVLTLERNGHIARTPGVPRSIQVLLDDSELPNLGETVCAPIQHSRAFYESDCQAP
jgi:SOS-response transcriptional repressor LexA